MNKILLVEDHNALREALASGLNQQPDMEVVAQTGSLGEGRSAIELGGMDVAVVGPELPEEDGLELVSELHNIQPHSIPVLVLTKSLDPSVHDQLLKAGASEVLSTDFSSSICMTAAMVLERLKAA